jgi:hypothetical protein
MRAPIKDETLLAVMWERFPEIMSRKPQREWVDLTLEQYEAIWRMDLNHKDLMDRTIAKLKELNA